MFDGRTIIFVSIALVFWLLGVWSNRNANQSKININAKIASFFGGKNGQVNISSVSSQIGFASMAIFDSVFRNIIMDWNFRFSILLGGVTLLMVRYLLRARF